MRPADGGSLRRAGLGGRRRGGLLLPGHGDGPLDVAGVHVGGDLGAREGQHAVAGQGAADGSLVHVGGQAVPAVEFAGDVAVVVLRGSRERGEGPSETPQHHATHPSAQPPRLPRSWVRARPALSWHRPAGIAGHVSAFYPVLQVCRGRCPRHDTPGAARAEQSSWVGFWLYHRLGSDLYGGPAAASDFKGCLERKSGVLRR